MHMSAQFVTAGPEWVAVLLEAVAPPFALFRALWEAAQYAFLAGSVGSNTGKGYTALVGSIKCVASMHSWLSVGSNTGEAQPTVC
jgi:hypothetical protein